MKFYYEPELLFILLILTGLGYILSWQYLTYALLADLHVRQGSYGDSSLLLIVDEINHSEPVFTTGACDISTIGSDDEMLAVLFKQ